MLPIVRMGTLTMRRMTARRMDTMGRIGFPEGYSSGLGRGFMGRLDSMGMSTTGLTRTMAITDRCLGAERSSSTTSREMKRAMGVAMLSRSRTMAQAASMRCRASMEAVERVVVVDTGKAVSSE